MYVFMLLSISCVCAGVPAEEPVPGGQVGAARCLTLVSRCVEAIARLVACCDLWGDKSTKVSHVTCHLSTHIWNLSTGNYNLSPDQVCPGIQYYRKVNSTLQDAPK